jgi:predicted nucleic acid-binding protein
MVQAVFLDAYPLSLVTQPHGKSPEADACREWMQGLFDAGIPVCVAEITDYEVRRELIRAGKTAGVSRLDILQGIIEYMPINTEAMLRAADMWAETRNRGVATADAKALDGDVIMAAQILTCGLSANEIIVATTNVRHIIRYVKADLWQNIVP